MSVQQAAGRIRSRSHAGYVAYLVHRLSGLALAVFLPFHFFVLGNALNGAAGLDDFLLWAANPWVKLGEWLLVSALALHMAGGIRVLAIEFLPWSERQKTYTMLCIAFAIAAGLLFLLAARHG